ncbi:MAG TPA: CHASE3 domain-containing protein [Oxalicibacterium sp.]|uniref:sensor histidine kinase n=1 Tax=Oxalicibacterium sp. TaxID=2766525 RepID=UPI002BC5FCDE|nr:CHASE3 domain-containing protein [Oxalicibacterium sp.]HWU97912.1 CHASE3 domain-containing protein [Oxalicibacterium sp.]
MNNRRAMLTKAGLTTAMLLLIMVSAIAFYRIQQFADSAKLVSHTHLVIEKIHHLFSELKDAESAQRAYLITGDESFLEAHHTVVVSVPEDIADLKTLTADNPNQQQQISILEEMIDDRLHVLRLGIDMLANRQGISNDEVVALVRGDGRQTMTQLRIQMQRMIDTEEKLLKDRAELVEQNAASTKRWILFGNLLAVLLLLTAIWMILREIEHRRMAQREIEKTAAQLELTNKELESFSYSVSHDLRSPLRAIDGYSRIFEEDFADKLDDEGRRLLKVIRTSSKKMGQLIDDLLAFSRMGRKPVDFGRVDMNALVDDVWREVCGEMSTPPVLKKEPLPSSWGDRALLRQVLLNLLANAVKYSSTKSEPVIEVFSRDQEHETLYSIRDNGVGFDMRFYNKLFGVFQRLHTEEEFPGTGVGLAIAQRVIVRHGGRIWAESKPDEYTIFNFSLPKETNA